MEILDLYDYIIRTKDIPASKMKIDVKVIFADGGRLFLLLIFIELIYFLQSYAFYRQTLDKQWLADDYSLRFSLSPWFNFFLLQLLISCKREFCLIP